MTALSSVLRYGRDDPEDEGRELRAGPLVATFAGDELRHVRWHGLEIVRRMYVAVRDPAWNTLRGRVVHSERRQGADSFWLRWVAEHRCGDIRCDVDVEVEGAANGSLQLRAAVAARSAFPYRRLGLCVCHPLERHTGSPARTRLGHQVSEGHLPDLIGAQRIVDGRYFGVLPPFEDLEIDLEDGPTVRFRFSGAAFEIEDQRNWTDASFKSYCPPLGEAPVRTTTLGERFEHRVAVEVGGLPAGGPGPEPPLTVETGHRLAQVLPDLGTVLPPGVTLLPAESELLRGLPAFLRVEVAAGWGEADARAAAAAAAAIGCPLEVAIFVPDQARAHLEQVARLLRQVGAPIARFQVLSGAPGDDTTSRSDHLRAARDVVGAQWPGVPIAGGTDSFFATLNREPVDPDLVDAVCFPLAPQGHAFDDVTVMENARSQGETVRTAMARCSQRPVYAGPVTLLQRYGPFELCRRSADDPRQLALFGAAWTLASAAGLAAAGASSVTYFEATGPAGLVRGPGFVAPHEVMAGWRVWPAYHVLAWLSSLRGRPLHACASTRPDTVAGLYVEDEGRGCLLLANLTPTRQRVVLEPARRGQVSHLDETSVAAACVDPGIGLPTTPLDGEPAALELAPFACARITFEEGE
jgi:D-apionolactonase